MQRLHRKPTKRKQLKVKGKKTASTIQEPVFASTDAQCTTTNVNNEQQTYHQQMKYKLYSLFNGFILNSNILVKNK